MATITENTAESEALISFPPDAVSIDPERLGGVPCFAGTRVPVRYLWEYLSKGKTLDEFLDDFDGVSREHALAILEQAYQGLAADWAADSAEDLPGR